MGRALLITDVQNDFTEGGALGVKNGDAVASGISAFLDSHAADYDVIIAGVGAESSEAALAEMAHAGAEIVDSSSTATLA